MPQDLPPRQSFLPCLDGGHWTRLASVEVGDADNPDVVVCMHGLTRNGRDFDVLARALADRFRVVCPDVVGRGLSDRLADGTHYGYPRYVADVALLLARLDAERVHWIGTSMGGIIGMAIAAMAGHPLRSLVLNDVGIHIPEAALRTIAEYLGRDPVFPDLAAAEAYLASIHTGFGLDTAQWQILAPHSVKQGEDGHWRLRYDPALALAFQGPLSDVDLSAFWVDAPLPSLILRGSDSRLLLPETVEEMVRIRPSCETVTIPGCGHAPALQGDEEIRLLRSFLERNT